jgi:hypothetical protein
MVIPRVRTRRVVRMDLHAVPGSPAREHLPVASLSLHPIACQPAFSISHGKTGIGAEKPGDNVRFF